MQRPFAIGSGGRWSEGAVRSLAICAGLALASSAALSQSANPSSPPGYTTKRTGGMHDFDYFEGAWTTHQRRLQAGAEGGADWEEFPATLCMSRYLEGLVTVDELWFPTKHWAGVTVRTFDLEKHQWSIYWISSTKGRMETPVVGGFDGTHGEFYGEDEVGGRPVKVRFFWDKLDADHARWEQALSYDDRTWKTNWTADFVRTGPAQVCEASGSTRPRRAAAAK